MRTFAPLLAASALLVSRAAAEPASPTALVRLSATSEELAEAREQRLAERVQSALSALPEVISAHVELALPRSDEARLDKPAPRPRALVALRTRGPLVAEQEAARVVASVLGSEVALTYLQRAEPVPAPPPVARLGPFTVAAESRAPLQLTIVGLLTSNALLALLLLSRMRHDRSARMRARADHRPPEPKVDRGGRTSRPS